MLTTRKRGSFIRYSLSTMEDSNSCALVIRLRKEKRVVALPKVKFVDKNLSFQEVFTDVYDGDLHVRVKCRVGFKKISFRSMSQKTLERLLMPSVRTL